MEPYNYYDYYDNRNAWILLVWRPEENSACKKYHLLQLFPKASLGVWEDHRLILVILQNGLEMVVMWAFFLRSCRMRLSL